MCVFKQLRVDAPQQSCRTQWWVLRLGFQPKGEGIKLRFRISRSQRPNFDVGKTVAAFQVRRPQSQQFNSAPQLTPGEYFDFLVKPG